MDIAWPSNAYQARARQIIPRAAPRGPGIARRVSIVVWRCRGCVESMHVPPARRTRSALSEAV
eukprot:7856067-Lingulodinium_polyedra.AAC.1